MSSFDREEEFQLEVEFWMTVDQLRDSAFGQCIWNAIATKELLNRYEWYKRCEWCKSHTAAIGERELALDYTSPGQGILALD